MVLREIASEDVPALFEVRVATRENAYTREELAALGITEASVRERLRTTHGGWLCEMGGKVVGFSMADSTTGELWVIAVLPEFEGRGIGSRLLRMAEEWLWGRGLEESWLTTSVDISLRAYGFYKKQGWTDREIRDGLRYMVKRKPEPVQRSQSV
jgi:ribosomal protein S18 acetylase RimI-like enzyme